MEARQQTSIIINETLKVSVIKQFTQEGTTIKVQFETPNECITESVTPFQFHRIRDIFMGQV